MLYNGPSLTAFAAALEGFVDGLPMHPVFLGNVYDPTSGDDAYNFNGLPLQLVRERHRWVNTIIAEIAARHGSLVDLHVHFLTGASSWFTNIIELSLRGASEVRRCFLSHLLDA